MSIGKLARGLGKVGQALEGVGYVVSAGRALVKAIKGDPAARRDEGVRQDQGDDTQAASGGQ